MSTAINEAWPINLIGLSLSLFTVINIASKTDKHKYDLLLILWLTTLNIPLLLSIFHSIGSPSNLLSQIFNPSFNLLQGPILYAYVKQLINKRDKLSHFTIIHFIPFILFYVMFACISKYSPVFTPIEGRSLQGFEAANITFIGELLRHFAWVHVAFFILYSLITIKLLSGHQKKIKGYFSQRDRQLTLQWIYLLPIVFLALLVINIINESQVWPIAPVDPHTLHLSSYLAFIIVLCFFGIKQKPVFTTYDTYKYTTAARKIDTEQALIESTPHTKFNRENTNYAINQRKMIQIIANLHAYMESEKPYLHPDFSVYQLAEAMKMPRRTLSYILSHGVHKNFFQYVNEYRIEEVKALLKNNKDNSTILTLAFKAGFKSKSSFNSLFKQYCAMTPTQYRKTQIGKQLARSQLRALHDGLKASAR